MYIIWYFGILVSVHIVHLMGVSFDFLPFCVSIAHKMGVLYESFATVGEIRVYRRADFQSGSRVLKKVF